MPLIQTVRPDAAQGELQEIYDRIQAKLRSIPRSFQLMSASPALVAMMFRRMSYYIGHPTLSFLLLAHIRLLVASNNCYHHCRVFTTDLLLSLADVTEQQIEAAIADPSAAMLSDKDKAMLLFVLKAVGTPREVADEDIKYLHKKGWTDRDVLEATHHGASMVRHGILSEAFNMNILEV